MSGKSGGIADVDLATTATPEEMIEMFKIEQVRTFNEQGKTTVNMLYKEYAEKSEPSLFLKSSKI